MTNQIYLNVERHIGKSKILGIIKKESRIIGELSFSIESLRDLEKIPAFIRQMGISRWEFDVNYLLGAGGRKYFTFYISLAGKMKAVILKKVLEIDKSINWCLWAKDGDPIVYWNSKKKKAFTNVPIKAPKDFEFILPGNW